MIKRRPSNIHWNYFLAIESDLIKTARYIEFCEDNLGVYSIELAHILISASSEVDVLLREICRLKKIKANNINDYRIAFQENLPEFINEPIFITRYGLEFTPWENWNGDDCPEWWRSHNKVKHERNQYFEQANLQNTLNAVGALLIAVTYYHQLEFNARLEKKINLNSTTERLKPFPQLFRLRNEYYQHPVYIY